MVYFAPLGSVEHCIQCNSELSYEDHIPVYVDGVKMMLQHFCLNCRFNLPYIHYVHCKKCSAYKPCFNGCDNEMTLQQNFSSISYNHDIKALLQLFKFEGKIIVGEALKPLIHLAVYRYLKLTEQKKTNRWSIRGLFSYSGNTNCCNIVTTVPISRQRLLERGFNQASFFAEEVARLLNVRLIHLLNRVDGFEHTSHLNKHQREDVVKELYSCNFATVQQLNTILKRARFNRVNIIIVDDIYTTGHTLITCAKEIKRYIHVPCHIYGITLARA